MATVSEISTSIPMIPLGQQGFQVSAQGLGCAGMSGLYGPPKPDEEMISLIRSAVSRGVTFLDTSDSYGPHINEILIGKAIKGIRDKVQLATKFAVSYVDGHVKIRGDPGYVRAACEASLKRLDVDYIDLYYQHRVDTTVPIEITMGELKKLVEEGKIKYVGLSEPSADTIRRAHAVHPITAVQIEWSLWSRDVEEQVIPTCRELGIGIVAFSPLGRGFLASGLKMVESLTQTDFRKDFPRFQAENLEKNQIAYERVCEMSSNKICSPAQLALAWVHTRGKDVVPIPGTTKLQNLEQNLKALEINLTDAELEEIENAVSSVVSGERYPEEIMNTTWRYSDTPPLASWKPV